MGIGTKVTDMFSKPSMLENAEKLSSFAEKYNVTVGKLATLYDNDRMNIVPLYRKV